MAINPLPPPTGGTNLMGTTTAAANWASSRAVPLSPAEAQRGLAGVVQPSPWRLLLAQTLLTPLGMATAAFGAPSGGGEVHPLFFGRGVTRDFARRGEELRWGIRPEDTEFTIDFEGGANWGRVMPYGAGVYLNGLEMTPERSHTLRDGDVLVIGNHRLVFSRQGEKGKVTFGPPLPPELLFPQPSSSPPAAVAGRSLAPWSGEGTMALAARGMGEGGPLLQVIEAIRRDAISAASGRAHRDSPTCHVFLLNFTMVTMRFDLDSGRPLAEEETAPNMVEIVFGILPDENRVGLTDMTKLALKQALLRESDPNRRRVLATLLSAHGMKIVEEGEPPLPRKSLPAVPGADEVLPKSDPDILAHNLGYLGRSDEVTDDGDMTIMFDAGALECHVTTWGYSVVTLHLDPTGRIVGLEKMRPLAESPRGTTYRQGVCAGDKVQMVCRAGIPVWHEPLGHLNSAQQVAILDLDQATADRRYTFLCQDRYAVDMVFDTGVGPFLRDIASLLGHVAHRKGGEEVSLTVVIARDGQGALHAFDSNFLPRHRDPYHPIGEMTLRVKPKKRAAKKDGFQTAEFDLIEITGFSDAFEHERDILEAMEWLKTQVIPKHEADEDLMRTVYFEVEGIGVSAAVRAARALPPPRPASPPQRQGRRWWPWGKKE